MRALIYSLMTDRTNNAGFGPVKFILYILSLIYGAAIFLRRFLYNVGIFKSETVPIKVISVGNLTLGGTGKTPFVIRLARILKDDLRLETGVLIRGYGWDEQAMLKKNLSDIPVLVGENRAKLARRAIKLYGSRAAVLDDGFQYWELARDINIVLIDSRNPFGNGHLFPRGVLREPKDAIKRSEIVIFTKIDKKACDIAAVKEELKGFNPGLVFLEARHKPVRLYDVRTKRGYDLPYLGLKRVILVSSIGDPAYFEETVKDLKAKVIEHIVFGDHHNFKAGDIERIIRRCDERVFDLLLTTEKDAVKLARKHLSFGRYTLMALAVEMEITSGKEILIDRLHSLFNS